MRRTCRESSTRSLLSSPFASTSAPSTFALALLAIAAQALPGQDPGARPQRSATPPAFDAGTVRDLAWRNLGPANPMGRVTDIAVAPQDASLRYVGTGGGGVFKTTNAGTTWENVFDKIGNVSIGDVAIAPSNPDIVWIGTGEENARNSVQWGNGVFKSTDGGKTFEPMGLRETFQIGHVEIHPTNPDIVYVAALGRLWGENEERGVFRTKDGGATWERVLFLDDRTGCIDVRVHPKDPNTVFACMFERKRDEFDSNDPATRFGKSAGLYKSTDGGDTWREISAGLPTCEWGRSGIDLWEQNPDVMFLIVETERSGWVTGDHKDRQPGDPEPPRRRGQGQGPGGQGGGRQGRGTALMGIGTEGEDGGESTPGAVLTQVTPDGPTAKAGLRVGDRITKVDDEEIKSYEELIALVRRSRAEQEVQVTYVRDDQPATVALTFAAGGTGGGGGRGATFPNGEFGGRLNGQQENVQDHQGPEGFQTGGIFRSDDRGETWRRINSLTERPFYYSVIRVDPRSDQHLYCVGTTLWGSSDGGKTFAGINRGIHVDFHAFWIDPNDGEHLIACCDGGVNVSHDRGKTWEVQNGFCAAQYYDVVADNSVPYNVIGGLQDNGTWVGPSRTRNREGITTHDWFTIYGGDGFGAQTDPVEPWIVFATSQNGALGMVDLRGGGQARIQRERPPQGQRAGFNWDSPFVLSPHNRLILWSAGNHVYRTDRYAHLDNRENRDDQGPVTNARGMTAQIVSPELGRTERGTATALAESPRERGLLYVGTDDGALWRGTVGGEWTRIDGNLPAMPGPRYVSDIVPSHHRTDRVYVTLDGHRYDDFRTYVFVSEDRGATWRTLALDLPLEEPTFAICEDPRQENLLFLGTEYSCYVSLDRGEHWQRLGSGLPTVAVRDVFLHDRDSDIVIATHGRGVWVVDVAPLRRFDQEVADAAAHLFEPEDAILWRMTSRGFTGNREFRAPNPPYGTTIYVHLREVPEAAPTVTIHDVTGKQLAELKGEKRSGLQALQWDARLGNRLAAPGTYAAKLTFAGETQARAFRLLPDPIVAAEAAAAATTTTSTTGQKE